MMRYYFFALMILSGCSQASTVRDCEAAVEARKWAMAEAVCKEAAEAGHVDAMVHLASVYRRDRTNSKDVRKGTLWLEKAADSGHLRAQGILSFYYTYEKRNRVKAERYHLLALENDRNNIVRLNSIGRFYRTHNKDIENNPSLSVEEKHRQLQSRWKKSFEMHMRAAELGSTYGQLKLGDLYKDGMGVKQSWAKAISWYKKAARQGGKDHVYGFSRLGYLYLHGINHDGEVIIPKDAARAYGYLKYASDNSEDRPNPDLRTFRAFIDNPAKPLPHFETTGKTHDVNPSRGLQKYRLVDKKIRLEGEKIYDQIVSGVPPL